MPDVSEAQKHFMGMSQSPEGRAKLRSYGKKPAPVSVAQEFTAADKAAGNPKLPKRVKPSNPDGTRRILGTRGYD
jgi:hypothetical protein